MPAINDLTGLRVILISPNVSERMGGEAIKALEIYRELARAGADVHQITHVRVREELARQHPFMRVSYVNDSAAQRTAWKLGLTHPAWRIIFDPVIAMAFQWKSARLAESLLRQRPGTIVHFTSPISPALPYFRLSGGPVVIGPLNGNIHHPPAFRGREDASHRLRRCLHSVPQLANRFAFAGKRRAAAILVAGGARTRESLIMAGCRDHQLIDSLDSGVADSFFSLPRIEHRGRNLSFVHYGRLVKYKGLDLAIRALKKTRHPIELTIIGQGPEALGLRRLTDQLSLRDRVNFVDWIDHARLPRTLRGYRALVSPALAEANGIAIQEAMVLGLPVIALSWGGPSLLVTNETGRLIEPRGEDHVIDELARAMDVLAEDGDLANRMSAAGRLRAIDQGFAWSVVISQWADVYQRVSGYRSLACQPSMGPASHRGTSAGPREAHADVTLAS